MPQKWTARSLTWRLPILGLALFMLAAMVRAIIIYHESWWPLANSIVVMIACAAAMRIRVIREFIHGPTKRLMVVGLALWAAAVPIFGLGFYLMYNKIVIPAFAEWFFLAPFLLGTFAMSLAIVRSASTRQS